MSEHDFKKEFISQMLGLNHSFPERRKNEDLMQSVLAVLLEYNTEYAKGIEELIKYGGNQNELLMELKNKTEAMRVLLEGMASSYVDLETLIKEQGKDQKEFVKTSLKSVYEYIGVTDEGVPHSPVDNIVIKLKQAIKHKLMYLIAGMLLIKFLPYLVAILGK